MTRPTDLPPDLPPGRLDYATARPAAVDPDWYALSRHLLGWGLLEALLVVMVARVIPKFEAIFVDFKLDLPAPTKLLLALSRGSGIMLLVVMTAIGILHAFAAAVWYPRSSRPARFLYRTALFLLFAGVVAFVVLALFLPYLHLIDAVSGTGSKR